MKRALFPCVGNSGRSQMTEAFFKHLAKRKAHVTLAGTDPATEVDPTVVELMEEIGS